MAVIPPGTSLDAAARERVDALAELFRRAVGQLEEIERGLRYGRPTRTLLRRRLREARDIIDRLLSLQDGTASGAVLEWARENIPETYRYGAGLAVRDLQAQGFPVRVGRPQIHSRAVEALLSRYLIDATEIVVQLHANVIRASRVVLAQAGFGEEIAAGIIGGLPRRRTSKLLERSLRRAVEGVLPDGAEVDLTHVEINGRRFRLDTWAEMHARTETARASTAGTRKLCEANDVFYVQITTHSHAPCICTPFEGRIYSLRNNDPDYPWIGIVPNGGCPMHPNCVHREAPAVIDFLEARGDVQGRTRIPADFVGLNVSELARVVRENREQLRRYSESRTGLLPETFRLRSAA